MKTLKIAAASLGLLAAVMTVAPGTSDARNPERKAKRKAYKKEIRQIEKELFRRAVPLRQDVEHAPDMTRAVGFTETLGGRRYARTDPDVVYEAFCAVHVLELALRLDDKLRVRVWAPGTAGDTTAMLLTLDPDEAGSVRAAVQELLYLPGDEPTEEAVQACLERYPAHDAELSADRCSLTLFRR